MRIARFHVVVPFTVLLSVLPALVAEAARPPVLRLRLPEGQTNAYKIQIETRAENGVEVMAGNILVTPRAGPSNVICLNLRGTLMPQPQSGMPPRLDDWGRPRWISTVTLGDAAEIQLDNRGHFLRVAGDPPLPFPLGSVAQVLIEPLPASSESRWEFVEELAVLDGPLSMGPARALIPAQLPGMPYYPGSYDPRKSPGVLAVTRKVQCETKSFTAEQVVVSNRIALASLLKYGTEPRLSASGEGEFVLDRASGFLRRAQAQFNSVVNSENVTRRTATTLRITLLEGRERDAALQQLTPPSGRAARKLTLDEVQKIINDLQSADADDAARDKAASQLLSSEFAEAPPALLELMGSLLNDPRTMMRWAAAKVIADHGTAEQVPILIKLLKSTDSSMRSSAIRGLGRLKDARAAEPLVALVARGDSDSYQIVEALARLGPDVEDTVLPLLGEKNVETRRRACEVLKRVGTQKSLAPLRELMLDPDMSLNSAAAEAVREITGRQ